MNEICEYCGGRHDRPGLYGCDGQSHAIPDLAQQIVALMESELDDRKGLGLEGVDSDIAYEIRDTIAMNIRKLFQRLDPDDRLHYIPKEGQ